MSDEHKLKREDCPAVVELHASQVNTYKTCPRFYRYRYVDNLVPKSESVKLFVGKGVHAGIAGYYQGDDPIKAYDSWLTEKMSKLPPDVPKEHLEKMLNEAALGRKLVTAYVNYTKANDAFEVVAVEQEFAVPIYTPDFSKKLDDVYHVGRFDGIVRDIHGNLWVLEHKTCSQFPKESELRRREQGGFYTLAATQLFDEPVKGVIYNLIRKQDPGRARTPIINRVEIPYNEHSIRSFARRLYNAYMKISQETTFDPSDGQYCNWMCPYGVLCDAEDDGTDLDTLKMEFYEVCPMESVLAGEVV